MKSSVGDNSEAVTIRAGEKVAVKSGRSDSHTRVHRICNSNSLGYAMSDKYYGGRHVKS